MLATIRGEMKIITKADVRYGDLPAPLKLRPYGAIQICLLFIIINAWFLGHSDPEPDLPF